MELYIYTYDGLHKVEVTENNIHIADSFKIAKDEFAYVLQRIEYESKGGVTALGRSLHCMRMEWAVHNLCYKLGIKRSRTKDVDLDKNDKYDILYHLFGWIAWILIK